MNDKRKRNQKGKYQESASKYQESASKYQESASKYQESVRDLAKLKQRTTLGKLERFGRC